MSKQRNMKSFLVFCCISMLTITCIAEENERTLEGRWFGKLQAGSLSLRTGLEICLLYTSPSPRDQRGSGVAGGGG